MSKFIHDSIRSRSMKRCLAAAIVFLVTATILAAEVPRVNPIGERPNDRRLGPPINLNGYFPFHPCTSPEAWAERSERLRRQLLVATGLWPEPTKTPANAVIHGSVDRNGYTVEKVYFESFPGHFVTGNLYRPKHRTGRLPAVLCPHGHWANGRFYDAGAASVKKQIADGAEKFEVGGRYPLQARCVQLARMGCVVFHYDMVGYADSVQLPHRSGVRDAMNTSEDWGYFSPQAEARLQHIMGLQTYNSVRALDFLSGLPEVDPSRIAVTGGSGGGTQTFVLCAVDPRPAVAFPAVMVSTAMQGGCACENACYLRVGTGNVELAALISPRPLGMTAANDWTKELATKGLPELKQHYTMLGVGELVEGWPLTQFGHNYNYVSRSAMYGWLNEHLKLGHEEPITEVDYRPLSVQEMSVWNEKHPKPQGGDEHERALLKWITEDSDRQMAALVPSDRASLAKYREVVGGAVDVMIGRGLPEPSAVRCGDVIEERDCGDYTLTLLTVDTPAQGETLPTIFLCPKKWNKRVVLWICKEGKQGLLDDRGEPRAAIGKLLTGGMAVVGVDLFGQGEFVTGDHPMDHAQMNNPGSEGYKAYAGYTFGYNHSMFSRRVHDVLATVSAVRFSKWHPTEVSLAGLDGAGHWAAAARAQAGAAIDRAVIDTAGFRFARLTAVDDPDFLPGGAKYHDLPGMLALSAPDPLWLTGEGSDPPPVVAAAYKAADRANQLTLFAGKEEEKEMAAVEWLSRGKK